ncbi:PAS/PAC sensor hybrid histidine kinase [Trichormus variabilis ATCC 29413]|uniref:histidine kinase n=2 Tax=Anabaena variabilis TaxID=264691 RepID=Q3MAE9_TRIV2|nr:MULTISPECIES: PAS domain S-box protein [Nostocaceae]ABA22037.1 PAS/PAC sensor hybrid histidine kinase [Trichormus variabilis ATCC 29413]MBC1213701.1 PAS domain S-box protein [Trichormus variabilis ARAD]MBC1258324.1 PAS domain S-box protein [Trichormus variabilis V5]MBC1266934.1 PAS domain S-box protein [Trichormus variabilis FSR]MBC1303254.1 PAS domain S-box protein [Trichormus variabilis N2B]
MSELLYTFFITITAIIFLYTAFVCVKLIAKAGKFPSNVQLEATNQKLQQAILNSANYTIISTTPDGIILTFNAAAQRWLGYTAEEVIGKTTPEIVHDKNEVVKVAQELSQELGVTIEPGFEVFVAKARLGQVEEREWTYIRKDGSRFPVLLSVTPLYDAEENITGFLGIGSDITARKLAEAALRESEYRYATLAQTAPVGIFRNDASGRCIFANERACNLIGSPLEDILGEGWVQSLHPDDRLRIVREWNQAIKQNLPFKAEYRFRHPNNVINWVISQAIPERGSDGEVTGYIGTMTDINDRKRAEEELLHLSQALESAVEGISQLDTQGHYIKVNPAYAQITGYTPEEMIGMEWTSTVHPDDQEKMMAAYRQMLKNGKVEMEARAMRKDGSAFYKQVVMVKAYNQQQECIGHYCFMKDISDRREVERLKDEFVSVVSHELRTPLTSISGALDLLASKVVPAGSEDAQRMLNIAANNTDRLVRLINDILDIERIESGKIQITPQACNAADLMTQSVEVMEELAEQGGIQLAMSPLSAHLWADPDRIIQVFTNLISNAIKFSPAGATVWVTAKIPEKSELEKFPNPVILFEVKDQGRGIPADKLESIFERFGQVDASDSRQKGGTGLGLAICRSILQHHGGRIWAESTLGEGSTFFFTLPIFPEEQNQEEEFLHRPHTTPQHPKNSTSPLILHCDDDFSVRAVMQVILEKQGYQVMTVASGKEAVEKAKFNQPDAIILNLMMPDIDGWETLALLKQQPETQNVPVIILSGVTPDHNKELSHDVSDWIIKPPDVKLLCRALEKATTKQQAIKVLVVEDDPDLAQVLIAMFNRHGISTFYAQKGREAIQISQNIIPDLLVLDLGLPEWDGFAVVDWLRQHQHLYHVPLVVYTARDLDESDRQRLKLGETLFLTKGRINPQEFEQRVITLLNRIICN